MEETQIKFNTRIETTMEFMKKEIDGLKKDVHSFIGEFRSFRADLYENLEKKFSTKEEVELKVSPIRKIAYGAVGASVGLMVTVVGAVTVYVITK